MQKENEEKLKNVEQGNWNAEDIAKEATNKGDDEIMRQMLRGDATKGDPDKRDVAGSSDVENTPQGREEAKKNNTEKKDE